MSIRIMTLVWEHSQHAEGQLLTMLAIADHADDRGRAFPAMDNLAKKTRLSRRHLQRVIRTLEKSEELKILRNAGPHGTHLFQINLELLRRVDIMSVDKTSRVDKKSIDICDTPLDIAMSTEPSLEPSVRKTKTKPIGHSANGPTYSPHFLKFWNAYPKKIGKRDVAKIWKRQKLDAIAETITQSVLDHIEKDDRWHNGYVPNPATYLNQGRWEDEISVAPVRAGVCAHAEWELDAANNIRCKACGTKHGG